MCEIRSEGSFGVRLVFLRVFPVREELPGSECWLILRRDKAGEGKGKYQLSNALESVSRNRLARMSHSRYWMERAIQDARGEAEMGDYEVGGG